jgi:hypothetical protein
LLSYATGGNGDHNRYQHLRKELLADSDISEKLPRFVLTCRDLGQFWPFIQSKFSTYRERRQYIWSEFAPLLEYLERGGGTPADQSVTDTLHGFNLREVNRVWERALARRSSDPEGALTAARALVESVCKHILDDKGVGYDANADLPKLYRLTAECLSIAPNKVLDKVFNQILGGCSAVVEGLGALRNRMGDAHGKGSDPLRPDAKHGELAVNLAGSIAVYLVTVWNESKQP